MNNSPKKAFKKTILSIILFGAIDAIVGLYIIVGLGEYDCSQNPGTLCGVGVGAIGLLIIFLLFVAFCVLSLIRFKKYKENYSADSEAIKQHNSYSRILTIVLALAICLPLTLEVIHSIWELVEAIFN